MPTLSPFERDYGSFDAWQAVAQAGIDEGVLDPRDFPVVIMSVGRWLRDRVWAG